NQLTTLPPEIGQLSQLQILSLDENQLTTLPPEIGQLPQLQILSLTRNQLTTLPPEIGRITSLISLNLEDNQKLGSNGKLWEGQALKLFLSELRQRK
ncbi:MAG: leucine-rich repeat domain-containing protein, partial [Candidatus Hodarchaeota archaeon]